MLSVHARASNKAFSEEIVKEIIELLIELCSHWKGKKHQEEYRRSEPKPHIRLCLSVFRLQILDGDESPDTVSFFERPMFASLEPDLLTFIVFVNQLGRDDG